MSLLTDIEAYAALASGNQQEYFKGLLNVAKPVEVVSIKDVFTKDEIKMIKRLVRPKKKMDAIVMRRASNCSLVSICPNIFCNILLIIFCSFQSLKSC